MRPADPIRFTSQVRYWKPEQASGLAVADIPTEQIDVIGGLKQQRVQGTIRGAAFASNVMPAGRGRLSLSISKAMMRDAKISVGDSAEIEILTIGRE